MPYDLAILGPVIAAFAAAATPSRCWRLGDDRARPRWVGRAWTPAARLAGRCWPPPVTWLPVRLGPRPWGGAGCWTRWRVFLTAWRSRSAPA